MRYLYWRQASNYSTPVASGHIRIPLLIIFIPSYWSAPPLFFLPFIVVRSIIIPPFPIFPRPIRPLRCFLFQLYFLFFPLFFLICCKLFMITFGSLILCLFILSHFSFCYSFSFLLFSNLLSCEYFCPCLSATFILRRIPPPPFFTVSLIIFFFFFFLFSFIICAATWCQP